MDYQPARETAAHVRGLTPFSRLLGLIACLLLFAMMMVTFVDVVGRYLFSAPLTAAYELVVLMMPTVIFCALPLTVLREGHVTVDLLDAFIPKSVVWLQSLLINLFCAVVMAVICWRLVVRAMDQHYYEEVTDVLIVPLWPFGAIMAVLSGIATLCFLANAWLAATTRQPQE